MFKGLFGRLRRRFERFKRLTFDPHSGGQWLAGVYHEPKGRTVLGFARRHLQYRLFLPSRIGKTERLPLLLMLHGCSQTAVEFAVGSRMNAIAEDRHCAVFYPEQSRRSNSLRCWNWFAPEVLAGKSEAALVVHAMQHIMAQYPIDPARVYVAGLSAGGAMAAVLCFTHGNLFAACAIHSGVMFSAAATPLQAIQVMHRGTTSSLGDVVRRIAGGRAAGARHVVTLIIHGTDDKTVNPLNAEQILEQARLLAEGIESIPVTLSEDKWIEAGGRRYRRKDLRQGTTLLVRSILIHGLGHAWSGGDATHKFFDAMGPDASSLIMDFVLSYRLPEDLAGAATVPGSTAAIPAGL